MRELAALIDCLESCATDAARLDALAAYARVVAPADLAWALWLLAGGTLRPAVGRAGLQAAACAEADIDAHLFQACRRASGDWAEAVACIVPEPTGGCTAAVPGLSGWLAEQGLLPASARAPSSATTRPRRAEASALPSAGRLLHAMAGQGQAVRRMMVLLALGRLRVPAAGAALVARFLAAGRFAAAPGEVPAGSPPVAGQPSPLAAAGRWVEAWVSSARAPRADDLRSFAERAQIPITACGPPAGGPPEPLLRAPTPWSEWPGLPLRLAPDESWDAHLGYAGQRAALAVEGGAIWLLGPAGEDISSRVPAVVAAAAAAGWPSGTRLEGELVAWDDAAGRPAADAGERLRLCLSARAVPAAARLSAGVCLFVHGPVPGAGAPLLEDGPVRRAPKAEVDTALGLEHALHRARRQGARGLLLSRSARARRPCPDGAAGADLGGVFTGDLACSAADGTPAVGLLGDGPWWCPAPPLRLQAVWIQAVCGPRAGASGQVQACTLALWNRTPAGEAELQACVEAFETGTAAPPGALQLLPIARVPATARDAPLSLDEQVRRSVVGRFGPVRSLRPQWLAELVFDQAEPSARHKSGLILDGARLLAWRPGAPLAEADDLASLTRRLESVGAWPAPRARDAGAA